tara:strand:- start:324 stop:5894 length:5571 start_codon:yes stop_codon:yes gene_type:complete
MAYWDLSSVADSYSAELHIYNIPNDHSQITHYQKNFQTNDDTGELMLDINKDGLCLYLIDDYIGLFNPSGDDISYTPTGIQYNASISYVAIGSNYGYVKTMKTNSSVSEIHYFSVNDALTNNEIFMEVLGVSDLAYQAVISVYDDVFVIGNMFADSVNGNVSIYKESNLLEPPTVFSISYSQTAFGYQIHTGKDQIVVRSFFSKEIPGSNNSSIPFVIYEKSADGTYFEKYTSYTDNLSQVFTTKTFNNSSFFVTITYDNGVDDKRIKIHNTNNDQEVSTVFFDGESNNKSFDLSNDPLNDSRRDIALNSSFLFVRMQDYIYVFLYGASYSIPNSSIGFLPISNSFNEYIYNKKNNFTNLQSGSFFFTLDFSSNFFNPHKVCVSVNYQNAINEINNFNSITITKYDISDIPTSVTYYDNMNQVSHTYEDNDNSFVSQYTKEFYLQSSPDGSYNKFDIFFNNTAHINELEFILFTDSISFSEPEPESESDFEPEPASQSYPIYNMPTYSCVHDSDPGRTLIVPENGLIKVATRQWSRSTGLGVNPSYCPPETRSVISHIDKIKEAHKRNVKQGTNMNKLTKKRELAKYSSSTVSKRVTNNLSMLRNENKEHLLAFGAPRRFNKGSKSYNGIDRNNLKHNYTEYTISDSVTSYNANNLLFNLSFNKISPLKRTIFNKKAPNALFDNQIYSLYNSNNINNSNNSNNSKKRNLDLIALMNSLLSTVPPPYQSVDNEPEPLVIETPFATFSVYVTFLDNVFKLIINNFGNGFFYNDKIYRFDVSHYTNYGHTIKFNKEDSFSQENDYEIVREGIPGTVGSFIQIKPVNVVNDVLYVYTELGGASSGSFYNPISILPNTELPYSYTTITVTVELVTNIGFMFVFDNKDSNILYMNQQFKFDVSNPTNAGYYLKFSKDSTSRVSYNTISIGTPGTENACVYFFSPNASDTHLVYAFDEAKGYSVGDLYNPISISMTPVYRTLTQQRDFQGTSFALSENNNLIMITSNTTWEIYNISDDTTSSFEIDVGLSVRNAYIDNSHTLISCMSNFGLYVVKKYSTLDGTLLDVCDSNEEGFGDSIIKFNNQYIISSHNNNTVHVFDMNLNSITIISYDEGGEFGKTLTSNNDFLFVGAPSHNNFRGSILCYDKDLTHIQTLTYTDAINFGRSISVNYLNMLVVGGLNYIYEYVYDGTLFYQKQFLFLPEFTQYEIGDSGYVSENFGYQVKISASGQYIYVSNIFLENRSGVVYVYENLFNQRIQIQKIKNNTFIQNEQFGNKIIANNDFLLIANRDTSGILFPFNEAENAVTAPTAFDLILDTSQNVFIEFDLSANDVGVTFILTSLPQNGIIYHKNNAIIIEDGGTYSLTDESLLFYPGFDFYGNISFTYMVQKIVNSNIATVSIDVAQHVTNVGGSGSGTCNVVTPAPAPVVEPDLYGDFAGYVNIERPPSVITFNVPHTGDEGVVINYFDNSFVSSTQPEDYFDHMAFKLDSNTKITEFTLEEFTVETFGTENAMFVILLQKDEGYRDISDISYNGYTFSNNLGNNIIEKELETYSIANTQFDLNINLSDYEIGPGNYNILLYLKNAKEYRNVHYKFKVITDLGIPNEVKRSLGKILYKPTSIEGINSNVNIDVIEIWATAPENIPLPSIDITVTKSITIFYNLLDKYVVNFTMKNTRKSLMESIQLYRDSSFDSISDLFVITPSYEFNPNNSFSTNISNIIQAAAVASGNNDNNELTYFSEETKGVQISQEEYNILINYASSLQNTIEGISNGIKYWKQTNDLIITINEYKISYEILNDTGKLYQYIKDKNPNNFVSGLTTIPNLHVEPKLKEHVEQYYIRYGWPEGFIFDEMLMAQIISESNPI